MNKSIFLHARRKQSWTKSEVILLLERLELYISSGLSIDTAIRLCLDGSPEKRKRCMREVLKSVESGLRLSESLSRLIKLPHSTVGIISQGELSGGLPKALALASQLVERGEDIKKKCLSAMIYPVVIGIFTILLTIGLVRGVMPQIMPMLEGLHMKLPLLTRVVMAVSGIFVDYGQWLILGFVSLFGLGIFFYGYFHAFRSFIHKIILIIPVFGSMITAYYLSIFLETCGSLIESGLSVGHSYTSTFPSISFLPLRELLQSRVNKIEKGVPIGSAIDDRMIPPFVSSLLLSGELSGTLASSAIRASRILGRDLEHSTKRLTALIEPIMMICMGLLVGSIALSIMMPIYDISKALQH